MLADALAWLEGRPGKPVDADTQAAYWKAHPELEAAFHEVASVLQQGGA